MSGGHWDYQGFPLKSFLETIASDPEVKERFPALSALMERLGQTLYDMEHDLDWDFSGDDGIPNDKIFQILLFERIEADLKEARAIGNIP